MKIFNSKNYKYWYTGNSTVMFKKKNELDDVSGNVLKIASNTSNTWQEDREDKELISNTMQGKIAEDMFSDFIEFNQPNQDIIYLSYDEFRNDNYKKHAPIDGVLYKTGNKMVNVCIDKILNDVSENDYGKITVKTREFLSVNNVYTVEVKSSRIPDKDYMEVDLNHFSNGEQQSKLLEVLRNRDIFTYPAFSRTLGSIVHNFDEYCKYVRESRPDYIHLAERELKSVIVAHEIERKCNIYTRIFMDWNNSDSIIGYLTGYALGTDFFKDPRIINMSRKGKSENALYYVFPIKKCNSLSDIFNDQRLW